MEKIELKNNLLLWSDNNSYNWVITFKEITLTYISGIHPFTKKELSTSILNKILSLIKTTRGNWWVITLKSIKNYNKINVKELQNIKNKVKLGSGKYATVYNYNNYAVKVIKHCDYDDFPDINGKVEAKILKILKNEIVFNYKSPNIILIHQFIHCKTKDYIILEKVNKTLWKYLQERIEDSIIFGIIFQVLFTLAILQEEFQGFRHNDIKIDNILLDCKNRKQDLTFKFKNKYWKINSNIPLVKISDFDYCNIPNKCKNLKVGTSFSKKFGCNLQSSKIYDVHLFLNSIYISRSNQSTKIIKWLEKQLPLDIRGNNNDNVKYGRLKKPLQWEKILSSPKDLLNDKIFSQFKTNKPEYPLWGI